MGRTAFVFSNKEGQNRRKLVTTIALVKLGLPARIKHTHCSVYMRLTD